MSILAALKDARAGGITIQLLGEDLVLEAQSPPPDEILRRLARHKPEIVNLLRRSWSADDWLAFFDERAGFLEHEAGLDPKEAEARAFDCCVTEYINRTHTGSDPDICAHCGGPEVAKRPLIPFGTDGAGHVWLHFDCHEVWQRARHSDAIATLQKLGIGKR